MTFTESKGILESKSIQGSIISIIPSVVALLAAFGIVEITASEIEQIIAGIVGLAGLYGSGKAIYGRLVATHQII